MLMKQYMVFKEKNERIKRILTKIDQIGRDGSNDVKMITIADSDDDDVKANVKQESTSEKHSNIQHSLSDASSNLMENSSDEYEMDSSLYPQSDSLYSEEATSCDQDIPVFTFCA